MNDRFERRAVTLVECLVSVLAVAALLAAVAPLIGGTRTTAMQSRSAANLARLASAHACYAADWDDRQFVALTEEAGLAGDDCGQLIASYPCPPQLLLGFSEDQDLYGYYLPCGIFPGSCAGGYAFYQPVSFGSDDWRGFHRLNNAKWFQPYVNDRFYDPVFYAPEDAPTFAAAATFFDSPAQFAGLLPGSESLAPTSYMMSAAALYNPDVLRPRSQGGFRSPSAFAPAYVSPTVSQAAYPSLKSRLIEHFWLRNPPGPCNPGFHDIYVEQFSPDCSPYLFSHGLEATPLAQFFDGSVSVLKTAQAVADDARILQSSNGLDGLWSRDTPLGASGYLGAFAVDGTTTAHHVLTTGGILGRDRLH
ncbi:MAG: hypothetical protein KDA22_05245 [Phycisphaerales bacterium]|nr:hypothetical protein [Phycisphaerales bacterium]